MNKKQFNKLKRVHFEEPFASKEVIDVIRENKLNVEFWHNSAMIYLEDGEVCSTENENIIEAFWDLIKSS